MASVELDEVAEHIMAIRLNRPERLNALDFHLVGEIHEVLDQLAARDDCKLAIGIRRRPLVGPGL